ncbi:MAG TPA: OmpA family protein [Candidatus Eisenbacteria bacterium]
MLGILVLLATTPSADAAEEADVAVVKVGPTSVDALGSIGYALTVTNHGPNDALGVILEDALPAGVTFVSASDGGSESGGMVTWPAVTSLANGASFTRTVTVTAPATGTLLNIASATAETPDPTPSNNDGTDPLSRVITAVAELADLMVTKSGPATVDPGQSVVYTITVANNGPSTAATVVLRDTLPAAATFVSASNGGTRSSGVVTWPSVASLASGSSFVRTVTMTAPVSGATLLNVAAATSTTPDPNPGNNNGSAATSRVSTVVLEQADLVVTKTGPASVGALGSISYTLTVDNNGPSTATNIVLRDTLPAGVTFVSANHNGTESGGVVTWPPVGSLSEGNDFKRSVTVTAPATGTLVNIASATAATADPTPSNNNGSAAPSRVTTTVTEQADLAVTKSGPALVAALGSISYTLTVTNNGPSSAANVALRDSLPAGVTFASASDGGTQSGGVVTWPGVASLASGASLTRTVTVTAPASGTLLNIASATSTSADPTPNNNNGSAAASRVTTTVTELADLAVTKTGPASVNALGSIGYTLAVTNHGPSSAATVVVRDTLPAGVTFVSASNGGTQSGGVVTWPGVASLANGASLTRTVTVTAPASGTLLNIASATSTTADLTPSNNNGSAAASWVTTSVTEQADLAVTKSGPASVGALGSISYTLTVTNNGPSSAASVVLRDTLPADVTFVSASSGGTQASGVVTWPIVLSLANGASFTRTVTVTAPVSGTLLNVAAASAATNDPIPANNNGSAAASRVTTTVSEQADLAVTKSGPASVSALGSIGYALTVTNHGPSSAATVVVRDTLPAGVTFVSASDGGTHSGGVVTWPSVASLANGASFSRTVTVTAPATGTLLNVASATAATADPTPSNNNGSAATSRVTTTVTELADLAVTKTGPAFVNALSPIGYALTVTNHGPSSASTIALRDTLPTGVTFVSASDGGTQSGGVVTWPNVASLANGASFTRTVTVLAPVTGTLLNVAAASTATNDPTPANNNGSAAPSRVTTTIIEQADLAVVKSGPGLVGALGSIDYTLTVTNHGPSSAATVVLRDTLPAGVTFVSASSGGTQASGVVTWPIVLSLANGASFTRTVTVTAPASGTVLNIASATAATIDPTPANNNGSAAASRVTTTVTELADLVVTKTGPASVTALGSIGYTLTVTNNGPSSAATVVLRDTLPAGVTFVSASSGGTQAGGIVTWPSVLTLANGGSFMRTVTVTAPATGTLLNIGAATAATADPTPGNNNGSAAASRVTTVVGEVADLAVTKSGPATVNALGSIGYTLTVTNHGPSTAATVVLRDTLPAGVTFVSASSGGTQAGGVVTWPIVLSLANGASLTRTVTVTAPVSGTLLNIAAATSTTADPTPANNDGSAAASRVTTTVIEQADLAVTKTGPATVSALGSIGYTLTVTNSGPSSATNVVLRDILPAGVTFVSASNGGTQAAGIVTWPGVANLANGASFSRTVTVIAPATGTLVNVGSATASTADPDAANNDGSAMASRATTTIAEIADLAVTKSGPASVNALGSIGYTLTVTNHGPSSASTITLRDTLPVGVAFVSASNSGTQSGGVVTWPSVASLANGASLIRTVTVTAPATGALLNVAAATSATADPTPANNDGSALASRVVTVISEQADLEVTKSGPSSVNALGSIGYTLTVTNHGPSSASTIALRDTLPAGATFVSASDAGSAAGGVVTWPNVVSLAAGNRFSRTVTVTAPASGRLLNVAVAGAATADPTPANNNGSALTSQVSTVVTEQADLAVSKTGPTVATILHAIDYTLTVVNRGPSSAAGVVLRDTLPAGVTLVSASDGGTAVARVVTWPGIPSLANGASFTRTVTVTTSATGTLLNVGAATAVTADPDLANNNGSAAASRVITSIVPELPDLALEKTHSESFVVGQRGIYRLMVRNLGPGSAAGAITVTDTLPKGLSFSSASGTGWSFAVTGSTVTGTHGGPLAPGGTLGFDLVVDIGVEALPSVTNSAVVTSPEDPYPANDRATDEAAEVRLNAALLVTKSAWPREVEIADRVEYTVTVQNLGASPVPDLVVTDVLPAGFVYQAGSARFAGAPIAEPAGAPGPRLRFDLGTLASQATGALSYRVEVGPGASLGDGVNHAYAASATGETVSNLAAVAVHVRGGVFTDEGTITGIVSVLRPEGAGGAEELGVPGVRVVLEDGSAVITDLEGKYHFVGVSPRLHVVRVDRSSLPAGADALTFSNRQGGDGWSHFVDLTAGELYRADFALHETPELLTEVQVRSGRPQAAHDTTADPAPGTASTTHRDPPHGESGTPSGSPEWRRSMSAGQSLLMMDPSSATLAASVAAAAPRAPAPWALKSGAADGAPQPETGAAAARSDRAPVPKESAAGSGTQPGRPSLLALGLLHGRLDVWDRPRDAAPGGHDRLEDPLGDFRAAWDGERTLVGGRGALYLDGPLAGTYRLRLRYDSEHDPRQRLLRDLRPDELYPIYGDASVPEFAAQSRNRLYAQVARGSSFAEYGDFGTASANPLCALGTFHRVLNGGRGHLEWANGMLEAFGSRGLSRQVVEELPALGVSGPYALSRSDGLLNSERVEILTRDRNHPSVIVDRRLQQRFLDYSIEPFSGRILFRRAVPSVDENLNPISIRVSYESESASEPFWVYGGEGRLRLLAPLELGGAVAREEDPLFGDRTIASANGELKLGRGIAVRGEFARSDSAGTTGEAERAEVRGAYGVLDLSAFGLRTGSAFANPSAGYGPARSELGARGGWQLRSGTRLSGEGLYSRDDRSGGRRIGGQVGLSQRLAERITAELGFRSSLESGVPASGEIAATPGAAPNQTRSLRARLTDQIADRASIFGEFERDLENPDQRRAAVGGDVLVASRTRAYARAELISSFAGPFALNSRQERTSTVVGLSSDDTPAGTVFGEYRLRDALGGDQAQAAIGLRNRWALGEGLHLDASAERVAPLRGGGASQSAAGLGLDYTAAERWRGTGRLEWRRGSNEEQVFGSLGYAHQLGRDWALLGRGSGNLLDRLLVHGRSELGLAWRQTERSRWNALARFETRYDREPDPNGTLVRTLARVGSLHAGYQPVRPFQLRGQVAARFTDDLETDGGSADAKLLALRGTWDFHRLWDVGLVGRTLFTDRARRRQDGLGTELGCSPIKNLRLSSGYNWFGYADGDLTSGSRSERGFYVDFGFKLDEDVFRFLNPSPTREPENAPSPAPSVVATIAPAPQSPTGRGSTSFGWPAHPAPTAPAEPAAPGETGPEEGPASPRVVPGIASAGLEHALDRLGSFNSVHFERGSDTVSVLSQVLLDSAAAVMRAAPEIRALLIGYTDTHGNVFENLATGRRRAAAVRRYLVAAGVDSSRLGTGSQGMFNPVATGKGPRVDALNRRVEILYWGPGKSQLNVLPHDRDIRPEDPAGAAPDARRPQRTPSAGKPVAKRVPTKDKPPAKPQSDGAGLLDATR